MLLHVYTCIRYIPDPRDIYRVAILHVCIVMSCIIGEGGGGGGGGGNPQKRVAAMTAKATTVPAPMQTSPGLFT